MEHLRCYEITSIIFFFSGLGDITNHYWPLHHPLFFGVTDIIIAIAVLCYFSARERRRGKLKA